jgi:hypothetical protein
MAKKTPKPNNNPRPVYKPADNSRPVHKPAHTTHKRK